MISDGAMFVLYRKARRRSRIWKQGELIKLRSFYTQTEAEKQVC